uniref:Uncharacterized protein n=1 Tax=Anopheles quadriannulatus TaxID=34691 RepID=A0A182XSV4_ANOQN
MVFGIRIGHPRT